MIPKSILDQLDRDATAGSTPGPWEWRARINEKIIYLFSGSQRRIVMDFSRWGMTGAQPRFRVEEIMRDARLLLSQVSQTQLISSIDHPDALLIAAAPDLLEAAQNVLSEFSNDDNWSCLGSGECQREGGMTCPECVIGKLREILRPAIRKAVGK